jgi:hypothetical protein
MSYHSSLKRHLATEYFEVHYISDRPELYLDYLRGNQLSACYWKEEDWTDLPIVDVDRLFKTRLEHKPISKVLTAIREQKSLVIDYHSKSQTYHLTISPNRLVYASRRYHIRAYCHEWDKYIDVVFSRILSVQHSKQPWISDAQDTEWHQRLKLNFIPNPDLPRQARQTLLIDYQLEQGVYTITTCKALVGYVHREMERIDWKHKISLWILSSIS